MADFTLRPATKEDVPSMVELWYKCFHDPIPLIQQLFPDSEAVRKWYAEGFEKLITEEGSWVKWVVVVEAQESEEEKEGEGGKGGKVVGLSKWILEPNGGIKSWQKNWGNIPVVESMDEDLITEKFFGPMARQHAAVMGEKEHFFLEILATDPEYQKRGLGGKLLIWGREYVDGLGLDCYLDAGRKASGLYMKFGWEKREELQDAKCTSIPMVRRVGT